MSERSIAVVGVIGDDPLADRGWEPEDVEEWEVTPAGADLLDLMPEALRELARRIGRKRASTIWRWMRKGIIGSVPEILTYDWLTRRSIRFEYQSAQMGGRLRVGGAVVDFLLHDLAPGGVYVWRVMGEYWHSAPEIQGKDEEQRRRLLRQRVDGRPVIAVVDLWESDIYDRSPEVFEMAEAGVGLRG